MIVMVSNDSGIAVGLLAGRHPGRIGHLVTCWRAGAISVDGTGWFREGRTMGSSQAGDLRKFLRETSQPHARTGTQ